MTFTVHELPRALWDKEFILRWLHTRSTQGAKAWLAAYDAMVDRLAFSADSMALAPEHEALGKPNFQVLFKTRRGRVYRAVFLIVANDVFILRVRGPGQAPITGRDLFA